MSDNENEQMPENTSESLGEKQEVENEPSLKEAVPKPSKKNLPSIKMVRHEKLFQMRHRLHD